MKLYCGIDLHSNNCVLTLLDDADQVVYQRRLRNNLTIILEVLELYSGAIEGVAVESTFNWYWLVDGLMEAGYQVHLVNTAAIKQYEHAINADPQHVPSLISLARLHDRNEAYDQALRHYREAIEIAPKNATAYNDLGLCLARNDRDAESVEALRHAVSLEPNCVYYWATQQLASIYQLSTCATVNRFQPYCKRFVQR